MRSEFGQRLWKARKKAKLTQTQLADGVGMSQSSYAELEKTGQGSAFTPLIADKCEVSLYWLAYGTEPMESDPSPAKPHMPAAMVSTEKSTFSPEALWLAGWFDQLPNIHTIRLQVLNACTEEIEKVLRSNLPTGTPAPDQQAEKPAAKSRS